MKRVFIIISLIILNGCASQSPSRLLETINFGLLKESRISDWKKAIVVKDSQLNVIEMDKEQINEQLALGNLDVVVGLPLTDESLKSSLWGSKPVKFRNFDFYVRRNDKRKLHKYIFFSSFKKAVSQVGYVSEGEPGVVNQMLLEQSNFTDKLVPCGNMSGCLNLLKNEKIDSVFADRNNIQYYFSQQSKVEKNSVNLFDWVQETKFGHKQAFSLLVNQRSLTREEFNEINDLVR